jgi:hypothetical protein
METVPFTIASKTIKYLGINLMKESKGIFSENYKPLKRESKEDVSKWKYLSCSWISRINIVKMAILPKSIYMFIAISIKIQLTFCTEVEKKIIKYTGKHIRPLIARVILSKMSNAGDIIIPDFKLYYRVVIIKTAWNWQKKKKKTR